MYCTYFLFLVSYSLPPSSQRFPATVFYYCLYKSRSFSQKKKNSESYSVILKWGYKLLCKSLLITEYSGHLPLKSRSFFRRLTGTQRHWALSPALSWASWAFLSWASHTSLALFSKMGVAEYFLWYFLPLETKSASMQSLPGILSAQQPFISHPYPISLFTWDFSWVSQAPTAL